jgi:hypothetical protein
VLPPEIVQREMRRVAVIFSALALVCLLPASGSPAVDAVADLVDAVADPADDDAGNATAPVSAASSAPKKRKKVAKRKKKPAKPTGAPENAEPAWYEFRARNKAWRKEFGERYRERIEYLEAQQELAYLERQKQEARMRARLAQLRAEAASGELSSSDDDGDGEDALPPEQDERQDELSLSEQAALIGTLLGSPAGIVGVVLGGAAGGAAGLVVEKVEGFRSSVSHSYNERLECEQAAAEQQQAMVEELQAVPDEVTLLDGRAEAEELETCRAELRDFLALPANRRCADCGAKLGTLQDGWASVNLGVLVCVRCAALHRGLGVGNSRIKSLVYDHWDVATARSLMHVGNERAAQLYLARLPEGQRAPGRKADEERLRSWLTNKYVRLKWAEPEWRDSLAASRLRASKVTTGAPGARGRKSALKGAVGKAGGARPRKMGKMPSLSSDG